MASEADVYVDEFGRTRKRAAGDASKKRERSYSGANNDAAQFGDAPRGGLLGAAPLNGGGPSPYGPPPPMPPGAPAMQMQPAHRFGGRHEERGRDRPRSRSRSRSRDRDFDRRGGAGGHRREGGGGPGGGRGGDRDRERVAPVKEKERTVDAYDPHRPPSGIVSAEIPALATFPVWYDLRLQDGRLQSTDPPSLVAQQYASFKQGYVTDAASRFYTAHRHEEWFRSRYDPLAMLSARARRVAHGQEQAQEVLQAITSAAIGAVLPQLGGGYTGSRGLGLGLRQAQKRAAGVDPTASLGQAPVLLLRGVHPSVGREELLRALGACSSLLALPKGPAKLTGTGGMLVPTLVPPSDDDISRAAELAVAEVSSLLWAEAEGKGGEGGATTTATAVLEGEEGATAGRSHKRARAGTDMEGPGPSEPGSSLSEDRKAEVLAMAGISLPSLLDKLRQPGGTGLPVPVAVEMGDPKRLPGASYRRNVWLEYDSLLDAAVARHLLRKISIDVAGPLDPLASGKELARVRALAVGLGVPLSGPAEGEAASAEGGSPLSDLTLSSVALAEAGGEVPSYTLPKTVHLPAAEWHRPTYGGDSSGQGKGGRRGGRPGRPGEEEREREREAAREGATLRGYPYGRPYTVDIPSWASTEEQVGLDLPRALELAAVLDAELGLWAGEAGGEGAGGGEGGVGVSGVAGAGEEEDGRDRDEDRGRRDDDDSVPLASAEAPVSVAPSTTSGTHLPLPGAPPGLSPEVRASHLYRTLYGPEGTALHAYTPLQQLDIAIAYLRAVHCYDYYSGTQGSEAGDLRQAVGDGYRRQAAPGGGARTGGGAKQGAGAQGQAQGGASTLATSAVGTGEGAAASSTPGPATAAAGTGTGTGGEEGEGALLQPHGPEEDEAGDEAGLGELMYGQGTAVKTSEEGKAATTTTTSGSSSSSSKATPAGTGGGGGAGGGGYATFIGSDRARAAYDTWARQHADRCRNRLLQARRQVAANSRGRAEEDESQSACVTPTPTGAQGEAQPGRTKDGLMPVSGTGKGGESRPIIWASVKAAAERILACKARILSPLPLSLPDPDPATGGLPTVHDYLHVLLAEWYTASTAPDTPEAANAADGFPPLDPARLLPATVLGTARVCMDAAHENRTRCALCPRKIFKSPHFAMKHCLNKHPEEARAVFGNIVSMLHAALELRLGEGAYMRRAYYSDPRRPMPWHDPADLKRLLTDTAAAAQRITGNGINLPLYLAALADVSSASGGGGAGGRGGRGGNAVIAAALGLATGPAAAQAMSGPGALLNQLLSMALAGGIGPLGIGLPAMGGMVGAALGLPALVGGGLGRMGAPGGGQGMFNPGTGAYGGRGGRGGGRGGRGGGGGAGAGGRYAQGSGQQGAEGGGGMGQGQEGEQQAGNRGRRDSGGPPAYRDKDAVRPAAPTAIDYGKAMVSYDDI